MKTIHVSAIDPVDGLTRDNEVLMSRVVGWYTRNRHYAEPRNPSDPDRDPYNGPTTIVSLDSGAEYEIAEPVRSFRARLASVINED